MRAMLMTLAVLAACVTAQQEQMPEHGAGACDAAPVQNLIGRARSKALGAAALRRSGARLVRWIGPGDMVTMDHRTDRLDILLDAQGRVTGLRCG